MSRIFFIIFTYCVLLTSSLHADNQIGLADYIVGNDDRVIVKENNYPWSAIGHVIAETRVDGGNCTGSLVGKKLVLTAAHCLFSETGFRARRITFIANDNSNQIANAVSYYVPKEFDIRKSEIFKRQSKHDWALLVLDKPLGDIVGFFGVIEIDKLQKTWPSRGFQQAGFSADTQKNLTAHIDCTILRTGFMDNTIYHQCDGMPGDSGAPIWAKYNDKPYVVAVFGSIQFDMNQNNKATRGVAASKAFVKKVLEMREYYN